MSTRRPPWLRRPGAVLTAAGLAGVLSVAGARAQDAGGLPTAQGVQERIWAADRVVYTSFLAVRSEPSPQEPALEASQVFTPYQPGALSQESALPDGTYRARVVIRDSTTEGGQAFDWLSLEFAIDQDASGTEFGTPEVKAWFPAAEANSWVQYEGPDPDAGVWPSLTCRAFERWREASPPPDGGLLCDFLTEEAFARWLLRDLATYPDNAERGTFDSRVALWPARTTLRASGFDGRERTHFEHLYWFLCPDGPSDADLSCPDAPPYERDGKYATAARDLGRLLKIGVAGLEGADAPSGLPDYWTSPALFRAFADPAQTALTRLAQTFDGAPGDPPQAGSTGPNANDQTAKDAQADGTPKESPEASAGTGTQPEQPDSGPSAAQPTGDPETGEAANGAQQGADGTPETDPDPQGTSALDSSQEAPGLDWDTVFTIVLVFLIVLMAALDGVPLVRAMRRRAKNAEDTDRSGTPSDVNGPSTSSGHTSRVRDHDGQGDPGAPDPAPGPSPEEAERIANDVVRNLLDLQAKEASDLLEDYRRAMEQNAQMRQPAPDSPERSSALPHGLKKLITDLIEADRKKTDTIKNLRAGMEELQAHIGKLETRLAELEAGRTAGAPARSAAPDPGDDAGDRAPAAHPVAVGPSASARDDTAATPADGEGVYAWEQTAAPSAGAPDRTARPRTPEADRPSGRAGLDAAPGQQARHSGPEAAGNRVPEPFKSMMTAFSPTARLASDNEISPARRTRIQDLLRTAAQQNPNDEITVWRRFGHALVEDELEEGRGASYYNRLSRTLQEHSRGYLRLIVPEPEAPFDDERMHAVETGLGQAGRVDKVSSIKRPGVEVAGEVLLRAQVALR